MEGLVESRKVLWVEVLKESGKWKSLWRIQDFLVDGWCSLAVLGFLSATDVGRLVPAEEDAGARCRSESAGSTGSWKRRGGRRRRSSFVRFP